MVRRRSAALRDAAGVYHVASRLADESFDATVAQGAGTGADVLAGLRGSTATAAVMVRTTECSPHRGCEWRVGKETALTEDLGLFVALVDGGLRLRSDDTVDGQAVGPCVRVSKQSLSGAPRVEKVS